MTEKITNPELRKLMKAMKEDNSSQNMVALLKCMVTSKFLVPLVEKDGRTSLHAVNSNSGKKYLTVYADTDSFDTAMVDSGFGSNVKTTDAEFMDLVTAVLTEGLNLDGFILNPGTSDILFGKDMLKMLAEGSSNVMENFRVGAPNQYPEKFMPMVREFASINPALSAVYMQMAVSKSDSSNISWLICVDCDLEGGERSYLIETFGKFIRPYLDNVPAMIYDSKDSFVESALKGEKPLWQKM